MPRVLAGLSPVVLNLTGPGKGVQCQALQVRVIEAASHRQRLLGAPDGRIDLFRRCLAAGATDPEGEEAVCGEIRGQRSFIGNVLRNRARLATKIRHRHLRQAVGDGSLRPHIDAQESGEDLQLLRGRPTLLPTQTQRGSICLGDELAGLSHPAQPLVQIG